MSSGAPAVSKTDVDESSIIDAIRLAILSKIASDRLFRRRQKRVMQGRVTTGAAAVVTDVLAAAVASERMLFHGLDGVGLVGGYSATRGVDQQTYLRDYAYPARLADQTILLLLRIDGAFACIYRFWKASKLSDAKQRLREQAAAMHALLWSTGRNGHSVNFRALRVFLLRVEMEAAPAGQSTAVRASIVAAPNTLPCVGHLIEVFHYLFRLVRPRGYDTQSYAPDPVFRAVYDATFARHNFPLGGDVAAIPPRTGETEGPFAGGLRAFRVTQMEFYDRMDIARRREAFRLGSKERVRFSVANGIGDVRLHYRPRSSERKYETAAMMSVEFAIVPMEVKGTPATFMAAELATYEQCLQRVAWRLPASAKSDNRQLEAAREYLAITGGYSTKMPSPVSASSDSVAALLRARDELEAFETKTRGNLWVKTQRKEALRRLANTSRYKPLAVITNTHLLDLPWLKADSAAAAPPIPSPPTNLGPVRIAAPQKKTKGST